VYGWRVIVYVGVLGCGLLWIWFGFDSCFDQIQYFLFGIPSFLRGELAWNGLVELFWSRYGIGTHFSAFVIYGLYFYLLSLHLEKYGLVKSMNLTLSLFLTMLAISVYEWLWMVCYAIFHDQTWVLVWKTGQNRILFMETVFLGLGTLALIFLHEINRLYGFHFNLNKKACLLTLTSVLSWIFWIYYPFPKPYLEVETTIGVWKPSPYFPQTLWTIDLDPLDDVGVGEPYWTWNDAVHFVNILTKILITLSLLYVLRIRDDKD